MIELAQIQAPEIDYQGLAPLFATIGGSILVTVVGLVSGRTAQRVLVPLLAAASLVVAIVFAAVNWEAGDSRPIIEGALAVDTLTLFLSMVFYVAGLATVLLSLRADVTREAGAGEYMGLLLGSISGMVILAGAENLVTLFVGLELLSIPLYVLCAGEVRRARSLESGLKYLVVGSVGSATLLYGLALIYGATGSTDFAGIAEAIGFPGVTGLPRAAPWRPPTRCCSPASPSPPPAWPSRPRWPRSTSGRPTSTRARPLRSRRSWRWPPRRPRSP